MEKQEKYIIEGNKLIAEFMDNNYVVEGRVPFLYSDDEPFPFTEREFNFDLIEDEVQDELNEFGSGLNVYVYSYHNSWDWLMLAVNKIVNDFPEYEKHKITEQVLQSLMTVDIDEVFKAVVNFIEWYNQQ